MAYWYDVSKKFNARGRKAFLADSPSDIPRMPNQYHEGEVIDGNNVVNQKVIAGSMVKLISNGDRYMLNSSGNWILLK